MTQKYDYTIEPPEPKRNQMATDRKLDTIITLLKGGNHGDGSGSEGDAPEVTFEPDPDALPTEAGDEEPDQDPDEDEGSGQGEGSTNVSDQNKQERKFRFPSARRHAVIER